MPSSQRNCCRTFPLDLGVLPGGKWGQEQSGSTWVFLRRKALADLCCGSPSGRGSEGGVLGEGREAAAWRGAARERTWDYGFCPAQRRGLDPPGSGSTGALTPAWGQAAARPSLMGMLMWALSRGVFWPSRSTSTYGEGDHGSRGHSAFPCCSPRRPARPSLYRP